jgi:hypothetical protein
MRPRAGQHVDEVDGVIRMLDADGFPTVAELLRAADALSRCARPQALDVAVARFRVAVMIEQLERVHQPAPAAA